MVKFLRLVRNYEAFHAHKYAAKIVNFYEPAKFTKPA